MKRNILFVFIYFILSLLFVSLSILMGSKVDSYTYMHHAEFGFPFPFFTQDLLASGYEDLTGDFPRRFYLQLDMLDEDIFLGFHISSFILSVMIVFTYIYSVALIISVISDKLTKKARTSS